MTPTEDLLSKLNGNIFFKEFTWSGSKFTSADNSEVELADNIVWLDDIFFIFQVKDRDAESSGSEEAESRWFKNKVLKKGVSQIKATLHYFANNPELKIRNDKGHELDLASTSSQNPRKIVVYASAPNLPEPLRFQKFHESSEVGFIHLFASEDYYWICRYLITPAEIDEYLEFREKIFSTDKHLMNNFPEQYLLAHFLSGQPITEIKPELIELLQTFDGKLDEFYFPGFIENFNKALRMEGGQTDYYYIIKELAKLKRNELREFKRRLTLSMEKCKTENLHLPYRVAFPRTGCGFVFIPLHEKYKNNWNNVIRNYTGATKYELRLRKCIGLTVSYMPEAKEYDLFWLYVNEEWKFDPAVEKLLKDNYPFRKVTTREIGRYGFDGAGVI